MKSASASSHTKLSGISASPRATFFANPWNFESCPGTNLDFVVPPHPHQQVPVLLTVFVLLVNTTGSLGSAPAIRACRSATVSTPIRLIFISLTSRISHHRIAEDHPRHLSVSRAASRLIRLRVSRDPSSVPRIRVWRGGRPRKSGPGVYHTPGLCNTNRTGTLEIRGIRGGPPHFVFPRLPLVPQGDRKEDMTPTTRCQTNKHHRGNIPNIPRTLSIGRIWGIGS